MENNLPKIIKQHFVLTGQPAPDLEAVVRDFQKRILQRTTRIPDNNRVNSEMVKDFEWSSNWAESLALSLCNDSRYFRMPDQKIAPPVSFDVFCDLYDVENRLSSISFSQLNAGECAAIVERMKHFHICDIDDTLVDALYDASNWVISESITEETCLRELEMTQDAVQRAELYMMMGNDVEAYREFKCITSEEGSNPENALALVNLVERYESPKSAIRILRKWFLLEIVLHSLSFDLVFDLLTERKKMTPSPRVRYLQSILLQSETLDQNELCNHLLLVIPPTTQFKPDMPDVDLRLKSFGLSLDSMDLILDENESVNLCSLLNGVTDQLIHLADLAHNSKNEKLSLKAMGRAVLCCFVLMNFPDNSPSCTDEHHNCSKNQMIIDYLDDLNEMMEEFSFSPGNACHQQLVEKQIATLGKLVRRQISESFLEESDGMPGLPGRHGYY